MLHNKLNNHRWNWPHQILSCKARTFCRWRLSVLLFWQPENSLCSKGITGIIFPKMIEILLVLFALNFPWPFKQQNSLSNHNAKRKLRWNAVPNQLYFGWWALVGYNRMDNRQG